MDILHPGLLKGTSEVLLYQYTLHLQSNMVVEPPQAELPHTGSTCFYRCVGHPTPLTEMTLTLTSDPTCRPVSRLGVELEVLVLHLKPGVFKFEVNVRSRPWSVVLLLRTPQWRSAGPGPLLCPLLTWLVGHPAHVQSFTGGTGKPDYTLKTKMQRYLLKKSATPIQSGCEESCVLLSLISTALLLLSYSS